MTGWARWRCCPSASPSRVPLAAALGARTVLGVGAAVAFVMLVLALLPRSTRALGP
jgi:hypothetical protein